MSSIIEKTNKPPQRNEKGHGHHAPVHKALVDLVELLPASSGAWIMTTYMNQLCKATRPPDATCPKGSRVDFLVRPSRWMLLAACIVFGCSAASFLHRRQPHDAHQPYIFAVCVAVGAVAGECTGASADYIMLVHVSWGVCVAMLVSAVSLRVHGYGIHERQ
ncbi:hypothetical protein BGZ61DRAFT_79959 [Ilyonectria robusta]|uniref:uncharacterized protein n=1 Tax=Ilyonectria robusta TaxID=1079257 RepID=UPI001E8EC4CE|nr:uncharacterized protein BGZ61DRAFT_79959 [Ilyonectria robusta]KAH8735478.1 hypothetical protein BGZ61DRAFT_79959 [Ilyonectria robusta]